MHPTVGRIVHYFSYGTPGGEFQSEARAAIITAVKSETIVDLCVLNPTGMFFNQNVTATDQGKAGCWSWPPKG